jgi:hypothetical protein
MGTRAGLTVAWKQKLGALVGLACYLLGSCPVGLKANKNKNYEIETANCHAACGTCLATVGYVSN